MSVREEPLVSVVTPVYNMGEFLAECIESVLNQTYQNFEYIIMNNCSTDDTGKIAEEYARKDKRIRVYTNDKLLEIIPNHNKAIRLISPDSAYCKFLSADDWLFPEFLTRMVDVAKAHPSVGLVGSYQLSGHGSNWRNWHVRWSQLPYPSTFTPGREICRVHLLGGEYVWGTPTSVMYRADLVRGREEFYPNATAEADTSACYQCLQTSDFGFVHQVLSYERIHGKQISEERRTLNSYISSTISDFQNYGPSFLSAEEFKMRQEDLLNYYYAFLAKNVFELRDKAFWDYHKRRLRELGHPFSGKRLVKAVYVNFKDAARTPFRMSKRLLKFAASK